MGTISRRNYKQPSGDQSPWAQWRSFVADFFADTDARIMTREARTTAAMYEHSFDAFKSYDVLSLLTKASVPTYTLARLMTNDDRGGDRDGERGVRRTYVVVVPPETKWGDKSSA